MDKIKQYATHIEQLLLRHAAFNPIGQWLEFENQIIIDKDKKYFLLMRTGWKASERIHQCVLHINLKEDGKIWIQEDWTEQGAANELHEAGIPKSDIVLAFYAPYRREDTHFAAA
ncbi:MAG: XisI protein [Bacteroidota bacterium]